MGKTENMIQSEPPSKKTDMGMFGFPSSSWIQPGAARCKANSCNYVSTAALVSAFFQV